MPEVMQPVMTESELTGAIGPQVALRCRRLHYLGLLDREQGKGIFDRGEEQYVRSVVVCTMC